MNHLEVPEKEKSIFYECAAVNFSVKTLFH
jgi:hypothetical protein